MSLRVLFGLHCPVFTSFLADSFVNTYIQHFRPVKRPFYQMKISYFDVCKSCCAPLLQCVYPITVQYYDIHFRSSSVLFPPLITHMLTCRPVGDARTFGVDLIPGQGQNHQFPKLFIINGKLQYRKKFLNHRLCSTPSQREIDSQIDRQLLNIGTRTPR